MFDLSGKSALVTGASGAIGGAIARAMHRQGARVALAGTRRERLEALAGELGEGAIVVTADLADRAAVDAMFKAAEAGLGAVDILVNNAGITRDQLALRMKDADWDAVIEVDLTAAFRLSRAALRGMLKRRGGRIINISSVIGVTGNPGQANYAAAKAGLIALTKSLAHEVAARSVTVNAIAPGFIESAMTDALIGERRDTILRNVPAGTLGTGEDVAAAAVWLASAEARYVTGQTIHVNGGLAMP